MVEMSETAYIMHHATEQSLVIIDEIGRGTSTFDGLSLAKACCLHLAKNIQCLTLFATHFFELTKLSEPYPFVQNFHLNAIEHGEDLAFLYQLKPGAATKSYGLAVAKLAGIPKSIISDATAILKALEQNQPQQQPQTDFDQIRQLNLEKLTPKQALKILYIIELN